MSHSRDIAIQAGFYLAAAITGIAAVYVLNEWVLYLRDVPSDKPDRSTTKPIAQDESPTHSLPNNDQPLVHDESPPPPAQPFPNNGQSSVHDESPSQPTLPPLRVDDLPPPLPIVHDILSPTSFGTHADDEQEPSDTESFVQVLSPPMARGLTRRRSMMRAHDLFAASHISFSELGSLVAPSDEHDDH